MRHYLLRYLFAPRLFFSDRKKGVILSRSANARNCDFEGRNRVCAGVQICFSFVGRGTYVSEGSRLSRCKMGRYCSIGPEVLLVSGTHPLDGRLSTHPSFYSVSEQAGFTYAKQQSFEELVFVDAEQRYVARLGSDVWIGARAMIIAGVKIGNGAVIAAGSIVTKDVDDFSIVAGVPARHVRYRFEEGRRRELLAAPWWEQDESWVVENLKEFEA